MGRSTDSNFSIRNQDTVHKFRAKRDVEKLKSSKGTFLLYVDETLVGRCFDTKTAIEMYEAASNYHVSNEYTTFLVILFKQIKNLEGKIHKSLEDILSRRDYIGYTCWLCPMNQGQDIPKPTQPTWATETTYKTQLKEHFDAVAAIGKEVWARMETLVRFKRKWISQGEIKIEGNIIDGAMWVNPPTPSACPVWRTYYINQQDSIKQLDSLLAQCLLEHFNYSFPKLAYYKDWREVNFENLWPKIANKLRAFADAGQFEYCPACLVCYALKTIFGQ